jgi:hypothetical protein
MMHQKIQFSPGNFFVIRNENVVTVRDFYGFVEKLDFDELISDVFDDFNVFAAFGAVLFLVKLSFADFV